MKRIYIAGPYSADNVISVLENIRKGIRASSEVLLAGFAPFCPWLDFMYSLVLREGEQISVETYYAYSLKWLEVSDAVFVLPGWESSRGTRREIGAALALDIPVFYDLELLKQWRG